MVVGGFVLFCGFYFVGLLGIGYMGFYSMGSARAFFSPDLFTLSSRGGFFFFVLLLCCAIEYGGKLSVT